MMSVQRVILKVFFCSTFLGLWAQTTLYLVYFVDKPDSVLLQPTAYLSPYTLQRRLLQGIPIDIQDAPLPQAWLDSLRTRGKVWGYSRWLNAALVELKGPQDLPRWPFIRCLESFTRAPSKGLSSLTTLRTPSAPQKAAAAVNAVQLDQLRLPFLHSLGYKGEGIRIAIFDAGFPYMNQIPAFQPAFTKGLFLGGYDFVAGDSSIFNDDSHGTLVSSIILADDPEGIGYVGGAPHVAFLLARTENALSESRMEEWNWARAAEWADSVGVHIIQSSLGYSTFDDPNENYRYADMNGQTAITTLAARTAARKGILVVSSAGNEGNSSWKYITAPADADSILAVGAISSNGTITAFSSRGPTADGRIKPDVVAMGAGTYAIGLSGQVQQVGGTSFSAPLITSLAACLWQAYPRARAQEIREAILRSADRATQPDTIYGYGIPNAERAFLSLSNQHRPTHPASVQLYPNPTQGDLRIFLPDTTLGWYDLSIYDISGQCVLSQPYRGHTEMSLPTAQLRPGLYYVYLLEKGGKRSYTQPFVRL